MSEKFSIVKTIDLEKLNIKIDGYIHKTGETNPYIFMNRDTADAITCDVIPHIHISANRLSGVMGRYCGYKVFMDNELKFGEVEIR